MTSFDEELAFLEDSTSHAIEKDETGLLQHQLVTSPLLTFSVLQDRAADFPSRALLGLNAGERIYFNTNAPNSAVICGIQGSGKSHTVSCLLEGGLIADARIGQLPNPLSALVFHFDTQDLGRPCEAAFLSVPSAHSVNSTTLPRITVLCSPSNVNRRRRAYSSLPHVRVYPLQLSERDLTADRMLAIMGCSNLETAPLYLHTILRIVREIGADRFSYLEFKRRLADEPLDFKQRSILKLRLDLLDCFMRPGAPQIEADFRVGGLVLIDLTDPFLDGLTAAVLFDSVMGSFIQWQTPCGKLVVLDEAHKYLVNSDTDRLAHSISDIIRLQRHLATRVIIATQEPTVIPPTILDLASTIICHRFSSPAWCAHLSKHVSMGKESAHWFEEVMQLPTGHAIVFSPSALMKVGKEPGQGATLLGREYIKVRVRPRLTMDGGASHLAVQSKFGAHPYPTEQEERVADRPMPPVPERPVIPVSNRPVSPLEVPSVSLQTSVPEARALASSTPPPESTPIGTDISMSSPSTSLEPSSPQENPAPRKYAPLFGPSTSQEPSRPQENPARSTYAPLFGPAPSTSREPPWLQENPARSTSVSLFGPAPREPPRPQEKHTPSTYVSLFGPAPSTSREPPRLQENPARRTSVSLFGPAPSTSREPPWLQEKQTPSTSVSLFGPAPSTSQEPSRLQEKQIPSTYVSLFGPAPSTSREPPRPQEKHTPSTYFGAGFAPSASFHPRASPTASDPTPGPPVNDVPARSTPLCDWAVDTVPSVVPPHEYPASATPAFSPTPSETPSSLFTADPTRRSAPRTILTRSMYAAARAGPQGPPVSEGSSTSTSSYQPSFSFHAPPAPAPPPAFSHVNLGAVTAQSPVWRVASRFRHLVNYLIRHRADWEPVKLHRAKSSISAVVRTEYPGVAKKKCWDKMLREAVDAQLVQLINMDVGKKNPEGKLVRLIARGEFMYV
ncbi:hypothetical protein FB45DRAFT_424867 [Roridomyces roridus]|uniref:AAA+ ATPase domain-containing protein n=1 Tax=Roridomyces roridus TaxID=1738132 RepID=A0AAD7FV42_9AGAR|nr:hypothetical protein FB45DRAFT_424867 [Roridomyces roridus]